MLFLAFSITQFFFTHLVNSVDALEESHGIASQLTAQGSIDQAGRTPQNISLKYCELNS